MAGFEKVQKGSADRIIKMAEKQMDTRNKLEENEHNSIVKCREKELNSIIIYNVLGQILAFILLFTLIVGGIYLILNDKNFQGYSTIVIAVITAIGNVIYNKINNK